MTKSRDETDFAFAVRLTSLALLFTIGIARNLFMPGTRVFAYSPLWDWLAELPDSLNWGVAILVVLCLAWLLVNPRRCAPAIGVLACIVFWVLQDFNRAQPYIFLYAFVFGTVGFGQQKASQNVNALRIMISGLYFWAGFHKINMTFFYETMPWALSSIYTFSHTPTWLDNVLRALIYITPFFEAMTGILLLFPQYRRIASYMAGIFLLVVLSCFGPFGYNFAMVIWPWNIWLFLMELRLFWNPTFNRNAPFLLFNMEGLRTVSFILFFIAPVNAIFTSWYAFLGFKLISGNMPMAYVEFSPRESLSRLPDHIKKQVATNHTLKVSQWGNAEFNGVLYPTPYAYETATVGLCKYLDDPAKAKLMILSPAPFYDTKKESTVVPLCGRKPANQ